MLRYLPLVLFLLPLAMFLVWLLLARRKARLQQAGRLPHWLEAPWTLILTVTAVAAAVLLVSIALVPQGEPWHGYTPPGLEDGKVVPGHVDD